MYMKSESQVYIKSMLNCQQVTQQLSTVTLKLSPPPFMPFFGMKLFQRVLSLESTPTYLCCYAAVHAGTARSTKQAALCERRD